MAAHASYWYGDAIGGGIHSELPAQAIPYSKKQTKEFKKETMDALERIGVRQMKENLRFKDLYRMVEGKLSHSELSEVIPQLSELDEALKDTSVPTFIKHYDILGIIIRALRGEYLAHSDSFAVTQVDEIASNEYLREKTRLLQEYITDKWNKELELRLITQGLYNPEEMPFNSEEEKQQYLQQVEQAKHVLTPPEIDNYLKADWQTQAVKWAEYTKEADTERFKLSEIDLINLTDYLLTGRCFRHYRVGYDSYEVEAWSPLNTFYSQNLDVKYPQEGDYIGRIHYFSPAQLINRYGHLLTKEEKEKILNKDTIFSTGKGIKTNHKLPDMVLKGSGGETHIVPHEQYYDYEFALGLQDLLGTPMAKKTMVGRDGEVTSIDAFLPRRMNDVYGYGSHRDRIRQLSDNTVIRQDLIQVTEAYFVSYKRFGLITFEDPETGMLTQETVTEEILKDFLEEKNIKTLSKTTLREAENNPTPNTLVWDYVPEVWSGVKINSMGTALDDDIYIQVEPLEYQIKGNSKLYQLQLPVAGYVGIGLAPLILPYQIGHNIAMNQMYNLLEKEIGLFFLLDVQYLPSEMKSWGNTEDVLFNIRSIAKNTGIVPIDTSTSNLKGIAGGMMQFAPQNLSYSAQIADRMQLAEFYKNKAYEQIGFNPQRLGAPTKHETAEGVRQSTSAAYSQTEPFFEHFSDFKKRALDMHLAVAQYCQKEGKDISVFYTKSDATKAWLQFSDPDFHLRKFSIMLTSNSAERKNLETFKQFVLQNNTMGNDLLAIAEVIQTKSMSSVIDVARKSRLYNEMLQQQQHEQVMQQQQQAHELEMQRMDEAWKRQEMSKEADRDNKIDGERIKALGRASDKESDAYGFDMINKEADQALKERQQSFEEQLQERKLAVDEAMKEAELSRKDRELELKARELEERAQKRKSDEMIALVNKN